MSTEVFPAESFLISRLASLTVPVHRVPAPTTATYPVCVYDLAPIRDVVFTDTTIAMTALEATVRVVGRKGIGELKAHVEAVQDALHGQTGVSEPDGWMVSSCARIAPFRPPPYQIGDSLYQEIGGRYEIVLHKMPP